MFLIKSDLKIAMNRYFSVLLISALANVFIGQAAAADPVNGQSLAAPCAVCHGKTGIANEAIVPNLAGQQEMYLEKSLKDFRSGARQDRRMSLMAQNLSDADIKDLAAWYASLTIEGSVPD